MRLLIQASAEAATWVRLCSGTNATRRCKGFLKRSLPVYWPKSSSRVLASRAHAHEDSELADVEKEFNLDHDFMADVLISRGQFCYGRSMLTGTTARCATQLSRQAARIKPVTRCCSRHQAVLCVIDGDVEKPGAVERPMTTHGVAKRERLSHPFLISAFKGIGRATIASLFLDCGARTRGAMIELSDVANKRDSSEPAWRRRESNPRPGIPAIQVSTCVFHGLVLVSRTPMDGLPLDQQQKFLAGLPCCTARRPARWCRSTAVAGVPRKNGYLIT